MNENAKRMINMAGAIATINNTEIERMDLNKNHMGGVAFYALTVWYSDGKEITIRQDCSIVE